LIKQDFSGSKKRNNKAAKRNAFWILSEKNKNSFNNYY